MYLVLIPEELIEGSLKCWLGFWKYETWHDLIRDAVRC